MLQAPCFKPYYPPRPLPLRSAAKIPLKIIITSATLDGEKFSAYFNECPVRGGTSTSVEDVNEGGEIRLISYVFFNECPVGGRSTCPSSPALLATQV